eukprot:5913198-Alexandrium_andersonii.AAC.1
MGSTFGALRGPDGEEISATFMDDDFVSTGAYPEDDDDAVVERHVVHLEPFLGAATKRPIQFKLAKCNFGQLWIKVL